LLLGISFRPMWINL